MTRILLWTASYLPRIGGLEWIVHDLALELLARQCEVAILDANNDSDQLCDSSVLKTTDVPVFQIPCHSVQDETSPLFQETLTRIQETLVAFAPTIVHIHFLGIQIPYALALRSVLGYKLVATAHGSDLNTLHKRSQTRQRLVVRCLREVDRFTACSSQLLAIAHELEPKIVDRSRSIPNGVKDLFFERYNIHKPSAPYILACGRFILVKGFDVLLRAMAQVKEQRRPRLFIVGDGPMRDELVALLYSLELKGSVALLGQQPPIVIAHLMQGSLFCVMPSRHEGFPLVALEAMASGKAVVASSVGGLSSLVRPFKNGLLVEPEDPGVLASAIEWLLDRVEMQESMGLYGINTAEEYRMEKIAEQYLDLYDEMNCD